MSLDPNASLAGVRHWLLDVEGTLVLDKSYQPVPGAPQWFHALRKAGHSLRILTNNSTHTHVQLAARLAEAGFPVQAQEIISGQSQAAEILSAQGIRECWLLGSAALGQTLREAGLKVISLHEEEPPSKEAAVASKPAIALVMGYLSEISVPLLSRALALALRPDCILVALHKNRLFRNQGRVEPGLGAWVSALEYASGKNAIVLGKPSPQLFLSAARSLDAPFQDIAMVGDDPFADLAPARELNIRTVMVLSGKYTDRSVLANLPDYLQPDLVVPDVTALPLG